VAKGAIASGLYSVVVLDELNPVLNLGLLPVDEVVQVLKSKPEEWKLLLLVGCPTTSVRYCRLEMKPHEANRGISGIEVYTGAGKGKSTSALGKALQAIGRGIVDQSHRVLIMQWLKGGTGYTEDAIAALQQIYPNLVDHQRCGRDAIVWRGQQQELDYVEAERVGRLPEQRSHLGCTKQLSWMNSIPC